MRNVIFKTLLHVETKLEPIPRDQWPKWASAVASFAKPEDKGVGDTVKRMLGSAGVLFQATLQALGLPCGCDQRQAEYNARFPYCRGHEPGLSASP